MKQVDTALPAAEVDDEFRIVSKCGLYCDTCPAFQQGLCNGCPRLELGDCVVRDCAHLKKVGTCLDCELDSCYHFEAYTARRRLMRERTQRLTAKLGRSKGAIRGGCGCGSGGGCGSGNGGCSGCSLAGGCSAIKLLEALGSFE
jgi:hypothetical protein